MATYINNIFNFGRSLPSPFDTIANKKIKVSSKYGDRDNFYPLRNGDQGGPCGLPLHGRVR